MATILPIGSMDDVIFGPYNSEAVLDESGTPLRDQNGEIIFDRELDSLDFSHFERFKITNGVFPHPLTHPTMNPPTNENSQGLQVVSAQNSMVLTMRMGAIFVNGRFGVPKREIQFTVPDAHPTLGRRDIIIWREGGEITRTLLPQYIMGVPSASPQVPEIVRTDDFTDMQLAVISVNPGATAITQASITDTRMSNSVCGFVTEYVRSFAGEQLFLQIQTQLEEILAWWSDERLTWEEKQTAWEAEKEHWFGEMQAKFELLGENIRNLITSMETQAFNLINNDFDADWVKRGCVYQRDEDNFFRETWVVVASGMLLAERVTTFDDGLMQIYTRFFPWEIVEGTSTINTTAWEQTRNLLDWGTMKWEVI